MHDLAVFDHPDSLPSDFDPAGALPLPPWRGVLMVSPEHYEITYAINPHMRDGAGGLRTVDPSEAREEWDGLRRTYESLGYPVSVISGRLGLPDMVFAANQTFPFPGEEGSSVLLSRMAHPERAAEVPIFAEWFAGRGPVHERAPDAPALEGCGDLAWYPGRRVLIGGYGFRTDRAALDDVASVCGVPLVAVKLVDPRWYHLDTCFVPLDPGRALWVPGAFDAPGRALFRRLFDSLLEVPEDEATTCLAGNAHCPDGRAVVIEKSARRTADLLDSHGFRVHRVPTSEFLKAGGSVFCLKQMLF